MKRTVEIQIIVELMKMETANNKYFLWLIIIYSLDNNFDE